MTLYERLAAVAPGFGLEVWHDPQPEPGWCVGLASGQSGVFRLERSEG